MRKNNASYCKWLTKVTLYFSLFILGIVYACGNDKDNPVPIFETTLTLKNSTDQIATVFLSGDPIMLELSIRNLTDAFQVLTIPSHSFDFLVLRGTPLSLIWQWSNGQPFPQVVTAMLFAPRETKIFSAVWNQTDNNGTPVGTGNFVAQGFVATLSELHNQGLEATETRSPLVSFSIM